MAVPLDDLAGDGLGEQAELVERVGLDLRREARVGADRPADLADADGVPCGQQSHAVAIQLGDPQGEHHAGGRGLGVDAVGPPDHGRRPVGASQARRGGAQGIQLDDHEIDGFDHAHGQGAVEHVGAGHAQVQVSGLGPRLLLDVLQERDHVVAHHGLERLDAVGVEGDGGPHSLGHALGDEPPALHGQAGGQLDVEPGLILVLQGPELLELRQGVAGDHCASAQHRKPTKGSLAARFFLTLWAQRTA